MPHSPRSTAGRKATRRRVAIFVSARHAFGRSVLEGISSFCRARRTWTPVLRLSEAGDEIDRLAEGVDGIIAGLDSPQFLAAVKACGKPCVDVYANIPDHGLPRVHVDDVAVGAACAEHLLKLGFRTLAFYGQAGPMFSTKRQQGFIAAVQQAGCDCLTHLSLPAPVANRRAISHALSAWLTSLPLPVGLLAATDAMGLRVLEACNRQGLRVPEDLAVLGVDNDPLRCLLADPPLSSMDQGASRTGYLAAEMLDDMMAGKRASRTPLLLPPVGVVSRGSTDTLAIDDSDVAKAVRHIREHACDPMRIDDVLAIVPLSRRSLERRFSKALGCSLHEEIRRVQLQRATALLTQSRMPLAEIARACGFNRDVEIIRAFHKEMGQTPGEYRRRYGLIRGRRQ